MKEDIKKENILRILIEDKNGNVYAYMVMDGLDCSKCDFDDCNDIREMCCGLSDFGHGCWHLKEALSVEVSYEAKKSH